MYELWEGGELVGRYTTRAATWAPIARTIAHQGKYELYCEGRLVEENCSY